MLLAGNDLAAIFLPPNLWLATNLMAVNILTANPLAANFLAGNVGAANTYRK